MTTFDPSRISVTAKLAAHYRQFSDIPFAAEVAELIGADDAFAGIVQTHGLDPEKLTFYAPMFEARYKSVSELVVKSGAAQVLELASGYSLRGLDLTHRHRVRYVETDLPGVVGEKEQLLGELRRRLGVGASADHALAAADVREAEQVRAAAGALRRGEPLLVLCEGLIQYLTRAELERMAAHVRALMSEFAAATWMTPDFMFKSEARDLPAERKRLREAISGVTDRDFDQSAFDDEADLAAFLARCGFDFTVRYQLDEAGALSSPARLGLPAAVIDRFRPTLRVWVMTAKR